MTVTTIQTVTGKVCYVNPPSMVILTLEDNTNQEFKIPKDQKFNVDGQMVDAFALRKGMNISATKVVEVPTVVSTAKKSVAGTMPRAAATAQEGATSSTTNAASSTEVAPKPQTATGTIPPSPPPDAPLLVAAGEPTAVPAEAQTPAAPAEPAPEKPSYLLWVGLALLLVVILFVVRMRSKSSK
jgi:cobalamin biosynthesis Mg chelatase CobN